MRRGLTCIAVAAVALAASISASGAGTQLQHVTVIGDSVADGIGVDTRAEALLGQGVDADFELAPCRRLEGESCPVNGVRPQNAVDLIHSLGSKIGPNVVVAVGYNDHEDEYAGNVEDTLAALKAAGVKHVFWLTLRAARHPYITMNADIAASAAKHPELTVVDWNLYSRSHPEWFQADGIHLKNIGAEMMATLIHKALLQGGVATQPPRIATTTLPLAHRGHPYRATLRGVGGARPYRWSLLERAPAGIHLEASGVVRGTPRARAGRYTFNVQVRDADGSMTTRRLTLRIGA
ncbi:MAG TPA: putative Ig domain-containing protein [Gaiellaceae bacterium]|jgi:hypothetical protein|nr:putative Ig domain-containing protein [Gaiellaceae bacterium]